MISNKFSIEASKEKNIMVVGAGIFGILGALKLAKRGFNVTVLEKNPNILMGASYINQNRLHMGYHYPRSDETAQSSNISQKSFARLFNEAVVDNFYHYYCIARKGSLTTAEEYLRFCDRLGLPYSIEYPKTITLNKKKIELSVRVPEKIYDANLLREMLTSLIKQNEKIDLLLTAEIINIKSRSQGFEVYFKNNGEIVRKKCDAILNATYSNINNIIKMAGFATRPYQYELCEIPVVKAPWVQRIGCGVFDGPFFGILPFGYSNDYLLYDVELSVLERSRGEYPNFKHTVAYYNTEMRKKERFKTYLEKAKKFIKEMEQCTHLYSIYVTRIVLPDADVDDARPTAVFYHGRGFWTIFAGKISAAIPAAERITEEMNDYFRKNK